LLALLVLVAPSAGAQDVAPDPLPIVDAHVHYNRESWSVYSASEALGLLDGAGVAWMLVSSTPDDGTLALYELAPERVLPVLRPYRHSADFLSWTTDLTVAAYVEERLSTGVPYVGIGEFELEPGQAEHVVVRRMVDLAAERGIWLHVHAGPVALRELASVRPDVRVLWAHAGVDAELDAVASVLADYPQVFAELSLRASEIAPDGVLDLAWRQLFEAYSDRVLIGSDTWLPRDWTNLPQTHAATRAWLHQLAPDISAKLAFGNATQLFAARTAER
jgi:hypothetical protein